MLVSCPIRDKKYYGMALEQIILTPFLLQLNCFCLTLSLLDRLISIFWPVKKIPPASSWRSHSVNSVIAHKKKFGAWCSCSSSSSRREVDRVAVSSDCGGLCLAGRHMRRQLAYLKYTVNAVINALGVY